MSATQPAFARSGEEMTPPATLADRAKRTVLRQVVDRLRPLAYRRGAGGIRCLTFHYLFDDERERADRLFRALKREGDFVTTAELLAALEGAPARSERLLHLSIDDGFENIAAVAHPILKGLGIPYSLMVCPSFVGGDAEALDRARPVLEAMSSKIIHVGELGTGATMKLAVNALVHGLNAALSESLVLAERAGVDRTAAYEVFASGAAAAPYVLYKRAAFERPDETPVAFRLDLVGKDLDLILELALAVGAPMPQAETNRDVVRAALATGLAAHDISALAEYLRDVEPTP